MATLDPNEEIRVIKRTLSDACNNDIHRIAEEARRNYSASRTTLPAPPQLIDTQNSSNKSSHPSG